MLDGRYLLIDACTSIIQGVIFENKHVIDFASAVGNASEVIITLVTRLLKKYSISELDGMIYCSGPGSAMGIKSTLISMQTWEIFLCNDIPIYEYNSLDMALSLNPDTVGVCTQGVGETLFFKRRGKKEMQSAACDENFLKSGVMFLNCKNTKHEKFSNFSDAKYDISKFKEENFNIFMRSCGELKDFGTNNYKKWSV